MAYKVVDLRDKLPGSPVSNIGSQKKNPDRYVVHYSGPDQPGTDIYDRLRHGDATVFEVLKFEAEFHMRPGAFDPDFRVNGIMYHVTVWKDTVYLCRNRDAKLWHAGDGTSSSSYNYSATAVHVPTTAGFPVDGRTLQTLAEWLDDDRRAHGSKTRALVKGHKEVGATECPGQLMSQFVVPYRAGKFEDGDPKDQGGGDHGRIPVDGKMSRWEFGQVSVNRIRDIGKSITLTYDGEERWRFAQATSPEIFKSVPTLSRFEFVKLPLDEIPDKFQITYDGKKFGVVEKLRGASNPHPKPDGGGNPAGLRELVAAWLAVLAACVGSDYVAWVSGRMGEGVMAWAANALLPALSRIKSSGGFCATAGNLLLRKRKRWIFRDFGGWWFGGIAWWGAILRDRGILRRLTQELVNEDDFPPGTMFFDFFEGPELERQGHMAIKFRGNTLFQWDTGLGANTSRTLKSTYANVSKFSHYVLPKDLIGPDAKL